MRHWLLVMNASYCLGQHRTDVDRLDLVTLHFLNLMRYSICDNHLQEEHLKRMYLEHKHYLVNINTYNSINDAFLKSTLVNKLIHLFTVRLHTLSKPFALKRLDIVHNISVIQAQVIIKSETVLQNKRLEHIVNWEMWILDLKRYYIDMTRLYRNRGRSCVYNNYCVLDWTNVGYTSSAHLNGCHPICIMY